MIGSSYNNMYFRSGRDGELACFGRNVGNANKRRAELLSHRNKQYQWLLAESWEEFRDFLLEMYAHVGFSDHNFWPLQDFGTSTLDELEGKPYSWFRVLAGNKNNAPAAILARFREKIPSLAAIEVSNNLNVNLRLALAVVEKLRHIIIHRAGEVESKEKFVDSVLQRAGISLKGTSRSKNTDFVNYFFGSGAFENRIVLLELATGPEVRLPTYVNRFEDAAGYLIAYAHLLHEEIEDILPPLDSSSTTT